ncbi:MAG: DMT family transporter [Pseudomonadaceae bacterium]|nr:DMT family transporter [Pseudomonadaceae bacterium]
MKLNMQHLNWTGRVLLASMFLISGIGRSVRHKLFVSGSGVQNQPKVVHQLPVIQIGGLAAFAMIAFAANSLLARLALAETEIDPASFSAIRLVSGAVFISLFALVRFGTALPKQGSWLSGLALFAYAAAFSYGYVQLHTGTGALILFGSVQISMLVYGFATGNRLNVTQWLGFIVAFIAVAYLVSPGAVAPDASGATIMMLAGIAWAIYTIRGVGGDPVLMSAGNFARTVPMCLILCLLGWPYAEFDAQGALFALCSGVLSSGFGYVVWYQVLPHVSVVNAATIQLSVPAIAAGMGILFLSEPVSLRLAVSTTGILLGIAVVLRGGDVSLRRRQSTES